MTSREVARELARRLTASSCPTRAAGARATATTRASATIPRGRICALPRVLPRRHGPGRRREPSDRLDRVGRPRHRILWPRRGSSRRREAAEHRGPQRLPRR
jgi:hypothetical protein